MEPKMSRREMGVKRGSLCSNSKTANRTISPLCLTVQFATSKPLSGCGPQSGVDCAVA